MNNLFTLLLLVSIAGLFIGLISPKVLGKVIRKVFSRKQVLAVFGSLLLVSIIGFSATAEPTSNVNRDTSETPTTNEIADEVTPGYEVVYTLANKRYDGGVNYYLLIDPVDLDSSFQEGVKTVVRDMVKKNGGKISIEIHDSRESLEISYKQYGIGTLNRVRTDEENSIIERHYIASYDGELETMGENTLMFFPSAFSSDPTVGQFVVSTTFNP